MWLLQSREDHLGSRYVLQNKEEFESGTGGHILFAKPLICSRQESYSTHESQLLHGYNRLQITYKVQQEIKIERRGEKSMQLQSHQISITGSKPCKNEL